MHFHAIAGVDEAGRGPLAGDVVASAVMLGETPIPDRLNDSKKLTARIRDALYDELTSADHIWAIGIASVEEIDRINILQATMLAMQRAVTNLARKARPGAGGW